MEENLTILKVSHFDFSHPPSVAKVAETETGPRIQNRKYLTWDT